MSPTFYELEKADDYLSDSLSTKMGKVSLSKISISKIKEEWDGPGNNWKDSIAFSSESEASDNLLRGVNRNLADSPGTRQHYDRRSMDEGYARGIMKLPRGSVDKSPSKTVFDYGLSPASSKDQSFMSFGKATEGSRHSAWTSDDKREYTAATPSTKAGSVKKGESCLSWTYPFTESGYDMPNTQSLNTKRFKTQSKYFKPKFHFH